MSENALSKLEIRKRESKKILLTWIEMDVGAFTYSIDPHFYSQNPPTRIKRWVIEICALRSLEFFNNFVQF